MNRTLRRVRGIPFFLWHARHEMYHILIGLVWAWFLREQWNEFNPRWIWLSIFASLLPDIDHVVYWFTYGRKDKYAQQIKTFLRTRQWRNLWVFVESGHKHSTNLISHNYYVMGSFLALSLASGLFDWKVGVILFGAIVLHYIFDIVDDLLVLGHINPNWKRLGRGKVTSQPVVSSNTAR